MDIQKRIDGDIAILSLAGRLDLTSASSLKEASKNVLSSDSKKMVLNLSDVDFINSSGLGALVSILKEVRKSQGSMKLTNLAPYVKEIFDITQLSNIFDIFPDENQALSSF
ncbi:MAG: STAS domain-containing protein [candidate division Zixibacteria bacterium]|nr:STAS domain-containing protein [candidate division Zixibacteria bacterium]